MGCRKNAYRGLQEMSEYLEKQNEEASRQKRAFEEEQRKIWTPPSALEKCCLPWLAHGPHRMFRNSGSSIVSATSRGCSGCLMEHPKINLDFNIDDNMATASIPIALDPFIKSFQQLPEATETTGPLNYQMNGLLSNHYERLKQKFGEHLVSVQPKALAASQRAYEKQLERDDLKQAAKRRKVLGDAAPADLLKKVLEICYDHSLRDHLDVADIAWMRTSCKSMGGVAARMARDRMRSIQISYSTFQEGSGDESTDGGGLSNMPLSIEMTAASISVFRPGEPPDPIRWKFSPDFSRYNIQFKIYLTNNQNLLERSILFNKHNINKLEVARYVINPGLIFENGSYRARSHVQQTRIHMEGGLEYMVTSFLLDESNLGDIMSAHGNMNLQSVTFTFNDLLGVYVRKRLYKAKQEYNSSTIKKPADMAYIKALAKTARLAPGDARSFRGMAGWDR